MTNCSIIKPTPLHLSRITNLTKDDRPIFLRRLLLLFQAFSSKQIEAEESKYAQGCSFFWVNEYLQERKHERAKMIRGGKKQVPRAMEVQRCGVEMEKEMVKRCGFCSKKLSYGLGKG